MKWRRNEDVPGTGGKRNFERHLFVRQSKRNTREDLDENRLIRTDIDDMIVIITLKCQRKIILQNLFS